MQSYKSWSHVNDSGCRAASMHECKCTSLHIPAPLPVVLMKLHKHRLLHCSCSDAKANADCKLEDRPCCGWQPAERTPDCISGCPGVEAQKKEEASQGQPRSMSSRLGCHCTFVSVKQCCLKAYRVLGITHPVLCLYFKPIMLSCYNSGAVNLLLPSIGQLIQSKCCILITYATTNCQCSSMLAKHVHRGS